jgi:16S rRNA (uracil1498-N3)-methyltransferase
MRVSRVYQAIKLSAKTTVTLTANATNYLTRVLRLSAGDKLQVFNEVDGEFAACIKEITKQQVIIQIDEQLNINNESPLAVHLGQAIARGEKMDWVIQKATELGVAQITPLITERCGVKLSEERWGKRLQHWQAVAVSACEQCGRHKIPIINEPQVLAEWLKKVEGERKLILDPSSKQKLKEKMTDKIVQDIVLLVGPEGGLSEVEVNNAKAHNFEGIFLGPRILRTETAGIATLAAIQCLLGDA